MNQPGHKPRQTPDDQSGPAAEDKEDKSERRPEQNGQQCHQHSRQNTLRKHRTPAVVDKAPRKPRSQIREKSGPGGSCCRSPAADTDAARVGRIREAAVFCPVLCNGNGTAPRIELTGGDIRQHVGEGCLRKLQSVSVFPAKSDRQVDIVAHGLSCGEIGKRNVAVIEGDPDGPVDVGQSGCVLAGLVVRRFPEPLLVQRIQNAAVSAVFQIGIELLPEHIAPLILREEKGVIRRLEIAVEQDKIVAGAHVRPDNGLIVRHPVNRARLQSFIDIAPVLINLQLGLRELPADCIGEDVSVRRSDGDCALIEIFQRLRDKGGALLSAAGRCQH